MHDGTEEARGAYTSPGGRISVLRHPGKTVLLVSEAGDSRFPGGIRRQVSRCQLFGWHLVLG